MPANAEIALVPSQSRTADGASGDVDTGEATRGAFFLNVTAASGTSPTLDVVVEAKDPISGGYFTIGTFTQVTSSPASEAIFVGGGSDAEFLPGTIRVSWTLGGTSPDFTFSVGVSLDAPPPSIS